MSSQTLSSKPKEKPARVTLQVVVHESTSKLTSATGVMVHLFDGDVDLLIVVPMEITFMDMEEEY